MFAGCAETVKTGYKAILQNARAILSLANTTKEQILPSRPDPGRMRRGGNVVADKVRWMWHGPAVDVPQDPDENTENDDLEFGPDFLASLSNLRICPVAQRSRVRSFIVTADERGDTGGGGWHSVVRSADAATLRWVDDSGRVRGVTVGPLHLFRWCGAPGLAGPFLIGLLDSEVSCPVLRLTLLGMRRQWLTGRAPDLCPCHPVTSIAGALVHDLALLNDRALCPSPDPVSTRFDALLRDRDSWAWKEDPAAPPQRRALLGHGDDTTPLVLRCCLTGEENDGRHGLFFLRPPPDFPAAFAYLPPRDAFETTTGDPELLRTLRDLSTGPITHGDTMVRCGEGGRRCCASPHLPRPP